MSETPTPTLLTRVKNILSITVTDVELDTKINATIHAVIGYMERGGAVFDATENYASISDYEMTCIAIGVNDLLFVTGGEGKFSHVFDTLSRQLCTGNGGASSV